MRKLHPYTPLTAAICAVVVVLLAHKLVVSLTALGIAILLAAFFRPARGPLFAAVLLAIPTTVGLFLMHAPFGRHPVFGPLTSDGMQLAGLLSLRLFGAAAIGLTLGSFVDGDRLMRAMQEQFPAKIVYVVGSTIRLYPMARARVETLNQMFTVREVNTAGVRGKLNFVMPLIVGLVDDAAQRARPLQRTGIGEPGPRTVLNPVANPAGQRALRWVLIAATCATIVWIGVS